MTLRTAPLPMKVLASLLLLTIGIGYLFANLDMIRKPMIIGNPIAQSGAGATTAFFSLCLGLAGVEGEDAVSVFRTLPSAGP